jgi:hypothetical protein
MVCFRYIIVNTLYKGDNKYNNNNNNNNNLVAADDPDKKGHPGPPGWGFGVGLTTPHSKKPSVTKHLQA